MLLCCVRVWLANELWHLCLYAPSEFEVAATSKTPLDSLDVSSLNVQSDNTLDKMHEPSSLLGL